MIHVYTDGSALGNPGKGGWAVIIEGDGIYKELGGAVEHATNNQMELRAAIEACAFLNTHGYKEAVIHADSQYVVKGIQLWIKNWKKNNWRTSARKPVENQELWMLLDEQVSTLSLTWQYVEGHAGHTQNERCDEIARTLAAGKSIELQ